MRFLDLEIAPFLQFSDQEIFWCIIRISGSRNCSIFAFSGSRNCTLSVISGLSSNNSFMVVGSKIGETDNCYKSKGPRRQGAKTQQAPPLGFFTDMAFCIRFFHTPGLRGEGEVGWGLKMLSLQISLLLFALLAYE